MSGDEYAALERATHHARVHLAGLGRASVATTVSAEELRRRLGGALPEAGTDACEVIDRLVADTAGGLLGSPSGRFFAWVIGGSLPSALAADWLTSAWDQNAAMYACAPAAAVCEEVAASWLKDLLGLPAECSFALTTGCQMAHFTCLAAARWRVLRDAGWDVGSDGLCGAPRIRVLASDQRHGSVDRAVRFLGLGDRSIVALATDGNGQIEPVDLQRRLAEQPGPAIVVLNAADLNIGAFDAAAQLIPLARRAGAWVHIDGAFGLIARASRTRRALLAGMELADSWATDAHKWLNVPYDSGLAFIRDPEAHRASMTVTASYLSASDCVRDEIDWNPEWSRRARGFPLYAALRELGRSGVERLVDDCCLHARQLVAQIGALPGAQVLWLPTLNQGLVRFLAPGPAATERSHDQRTEAVLAAVNATGEAFFSGTTWGGRRAMRVSVVSWRTGTADVARTVAAVAAALLTVGG